MDEVGGIFVLAEKLARLFADFGNISVRSIIIG